MLGICACSYHMYMWYSDKVCKWTPHVVRVYIHLCVCLRLSLKCIRREDGCATIGNLFDLAWLGLVWSGCGCSTKHNHICDQSFQSAVNCFRNKIRCLCVRVCMTVWVTSWDGACQSPSYSLYSLMAICWDSAFCTRRLFMRYMVIVWVDRSVASSSSLFSQNVDFRGRFSVDLHISDGSLLSLA